MWKTQRCILVLFLCLSPSKKAPRSCDPSGLSCVLLSNPEPSCCRFPCVLSTGCNEQPTAGHWGAGWLSLQSCALSQVCEKPQSLPWVQAEWPWFSMLMDSHRQRVSFGNSRYSSGSSAGFILRSTWNVILSSSGGRGRKRRERAMGKFYFFSSSSLTTTSFLHSFETKFLFWLNGKSPRNEGWWGKCLSKAPSFAFHHFFSPPPTAAPLVLLYFCPSDPVSTISITYLLKKTPCTLF